MTWTKRLGPRDLDITLTERSDGSVTLYGKCTSVLSITQDQHEFSRVESDNINLAMLPHVTEFIANMNPIFKQVIDGNN